MGKYTYEVRSDKSVWYARDARAHGKLAAQLVGDTIVISDRSQVFAIPERHSLEAFPQQYRLAKCNHGSFLFVVKSEASLLAAVLRGDAWYVR